MYVGRDVRHCKETTLMYVCMYVGGGLALRLHTPTEMERLVKEPLRNFDDAGGSKR